MSITFKEIADNIKEPGYYAEIDGSLANIGLSGKESVGLIIGQKLESGSALVNQLYSAVDEDEVIELFGKGSEIHRQAKYFFNNNAYNLLKFIAVEQKTGLAATYNLELTASAVKAGMLNLMIAENQVQIDIAEGDTAENIIAALIVAINAEAMNPVIASAIEAKPTEILLTAKHKGECGNKINIQLDYYKGQKTASGVKLVVKSVTEGSGNASLMETLAAIGDEYFTDAFSTYADDANLRLVRAFLEERFTALNCNEATFYFGFNGTFSECITKAAEINSLHIVLIPTIESISMPESVVGAAVGNIAYRTQNIPGLQYRNMKLKGILPSNINFTFKERNLLLNNGVGTLKKDNSGNLYLNRVATTYLTKDNGVASETYLDLWYVKLVSYLRYSYLNYMAECFPCYKLADDDFEVAPGQEVATPLVISGATIALAKIWLKAALIQDIAGFMARLKTIIHPSDGNRADQLLGPKLINNLIILAAKIQHI